MHGPPKQTRRTPRSAEAGRVPQPSSAGPGWMRLEGASGVTLSSPCSGRATSSRLPRGPLGISKDGDSTSARGNPCYCRVWVLWWERWLFSGTRLGHPHSPATFKGEVLHKGKTSLSRRALAARGDVLGTGSGPCPCPGDGGGFVSAPQGRGISLVSAEGCRGCPDRPSAELTPGKHQLPEKCWGKAEARALGEGNKQALGHQSRKSVILSYFQCL